jgi:hypothetical protein
MVNFSIIGGVAVICRPTDNSNLLSYASQLPMEDPGAFECSSIHVIYTPHFNFITRT